MSTTVGNGLTVDGTVKASQATQAGEAVVLGEDGLVPASLVASGGSSNAAMLPHFFAISVKSTTINNLKSNKVNSTSKTFTTQEVSADAALLRYGLTSIRVISISGTKACTYSCIINLSDYASQLNGLIDSLISTIRTNLRGNLKISGSLFNRGTFSSFTIPITISDDGIEVTTYPTWSTSTTLYYEASFTKYDIYACITAIDIPDEGWY